MRREDNDCTSRGRRRKAREAMPIWHCYTDITEQTNRWTEAAAATALYAVFSVTASLMSASLIHQRAPRVRWRLLSPASPNPTYSLNQSGKHVTFSFYCCCICTVWSITSVCHKRSTDCRRQEDYRLHDDIVTNSYVKNCTVCKTNWKDHFITITKFQLHHFTVREILPTRCNGEVFCNSEKVIFAVLYSNHKVTLT